MLEQFLPRCAMTVSPALTAHSAAGPLPSPWALCSPTQPVPLAKGWLITRWKPNSDAKPGISQDPDRRGRLCLSNLTSCQRPASVGGAGGSSCPEGSAAEGARRGSAAGSSSAPETLKSPTDAKGSQLSKVMGMSLLMILSL